MTNSLLPMGDWSGLGDRNLAVVKLGLEWLVAFDMVSPNVLIGPAWPVHAQPSSLPCNLLCSDIWHASSGFFGEGSHQGCWQWNRKWILRSCWGQCSDISGNGEGVSIRELAGMESCVKAFCKIVDSELQWSVAFTTTISEGHFQG